MKSEIMSKSAHLEKYLEANVDLRRLTEDGSKEIDCKEALAFFKNFGRTTR